MKILRSRARQRANAGAREVRQSAAARETGLPSSARRYSPVPPTTMGRWPRCAMSLNRRARLAGVFASRKSFTGIGDIDQVMRNSRAICTRRLGSSNLEVAINRNRVATDDFASKLFARWMASAVLPEPVGPRMTTSSGSDEVCSHSPRAPGNGLAKTQKRNQQNHQRNHQQTDEFHPFARLLALVPFGSLGMWIACGRQFGVHSAILLAALLHIAFGGVVIKVEAQRQVRPVKLARQRRERIRRSNSTPGRAVKRNIA